MSNEPFDPPGCLRRSPGRRWLSGSCWRRAATSRSAGPRAGPPISALCVLDTVLVRLLFPIGAVALALLAEARGWGLFNAFDVPRLGSYPARGHPARSGHLSAACPVPRGARPLALAPHASRRPRVRCYDRRALSSYRDSAVDGDQAGRGGGARHASPRRPDL